MNVLHAQYLGPNGHTHHAIERQYVKGPEAFVVTYIEEISSLSQSDYVRINKTLDQFQPSLRGASTSRFRAVAAFAILLVERVEADGSVESVSLAQPTVAKDPSISTLNISTDALPSYCQEVPQEERRSTNDLMKLEPVTAKDFENCPQALKEGTINLAKMLDKIDRATDIYSGQVMAGAAAVATSFYNDPAGMSQRVLVGMYNFAKAKTMNGRKFFNCVNAKTAADKLCRTIPSLIAGGLARRLIAGGAAEKKAADEIATALDKTVTKTAVTETAASTTKTVAEVHAVNGSKSGALLGADEIDSNPVSKSGLYNEPSVLERMKESIPTRPLKEDSKGLEVQSPPVPPAVVESVSEKLSAVPGLKPYLEKMIEDPSIPLKIRRNIKSSLERPDTTVTMLTEELRNEYLISHNLSAFHARRKLPQDTKYILEERTGANATISTNAESSRLANGIADKADTRKPYPFKLGHGVFVQDRPISSHVNDLVAFVHELAHVKFDAFFEKNLVQLQKQFPSLIQKDPWGRYRVDEQLFTYLTERHAHEMEWAAVKATHGRYYTEWYQKWGVSSSTPDLIVRQNISDFITKSYNVTDPAITALRNRSLHDILINGFGP